MRRDIPGKYLARKAVAEEFKHFGRDEDKMDDIYGTIYQSVSGIVRATRK